MLLAELCSFFRIAVAEHCVSTLLSSFTSAVIGGPVEYFYVFEGATALAESSILPPLPAGVHAFAADVR